MEESLDMSLSRLLEVMQDRILNRTEYFGIQTLKNPVDFWIYQEMVYELKPDTIIEIGNYHGGSALALAHIMDNMKKGRVIAIDIDHSKVPDIVKEHPRITLVTGDACDSFEEIKNLVGDNETVLIIEDSSHEYENTLRILRKYCDLIKKGGYFIIEDGICHHGLDTGPDPGPYEAIEQFITETGDFEIDRGREAFLVTWNPKGFLKRIR